MAFSVNEPKAGVCICDWYDQDLTRTRTTLLARPPCRIPNPLCRVHQDYDKPHDKPPVEVSVGTRDKSIGVEEARTT